MNISLFCELNYVNPSKDRSFKSLEKLLSSTFCTAILISLMQVLKNDGFFSFKEAKSFKTQQIPLHTVIRPV